MGRFRQRVPLLDYEFRETVHSSGRIPHFQYTHLIFIYHFQSDESVMDYATMPLLGGRVYDTHVVKLQEENGGCPHSYL